MIHTRASQVLPSARRFDGWACLVLLLSMLVVGSYFVGRYSGLWAENDSTEFTRFIRTMTEQAQLVPTTDVYPNGYAAQTIDLFILSATGIDITTFQQRLAPLLAALVVLPAWLAYRELTGSVRGAAIATTLLFTQPEFLFVILRSSHEKFTRALMLLCFFWLLHSFRVRGRPGLYAVHVGLFYLTMFALISSNNLLAHSFIFAVVLALALAWWLERRSPQIQPQERVLITRLVSIVAISLGLVYMFTFYLYQPAQLDLRVLKTLGERVAALFLDVQRQSINPYTQVASSWVNLPIYFLISIGNWLLLAVSFAIWARQSWLWMFRHQAPGTQADRLIYLFYTAFMVQGVMSIFADASGTLGSNLQHRLFPSMSMLASALVGVVLARWRPARFALPLRAGMAAGIFCVAILSVIKATNEPLLSSKWTFYRPAELVALEWSDTHLQGENIWTEFDERLLTAKLTDQAGSRQGNTFRAFQAGPDIRNLLVTDVTRMRSARLNRPLPVRSDALRVYDNGEAELYHLRPLTPYQR